MDIRGFIETSLLDWDGKITSVVFLPGCNFNCPYCSNWILVHEPETLPVINLNTIDNFLSGRKDFIDGVVITGGEPTLHPWLPELAKHFKSLGLLVKLDTNGSNPEVLSALLAQNLLDYIAMDIKAPFNEKYQEAVGANVDIQKIRESICLIIASGIDHEFRTTVIPGLIGEKEIESMAKELSGAKKYVLQWFVPQHAHDPGLQKLAPYSKEKMLKLIEVARPYIHHAVARGV
jgi:pyruvate formate lyase activating enzyme